MLGLTIKGLQGLAKGSGIGAALGGGLGGFSGLFDGDLSLGDSAQDVGMGAGMGALGGGLFKANLKVGEGGGKVNALKGGFNRSAKLGGGLLGIAGGLGPFYSGAQDDSALASPLGATGPLQGPGMSAGGSLSLSNGEMPSFLSDGSYFGGLGAFPDAAPKSIDDWYADPGLNKIANDQILGQNAATMRDIAGVKNIRDKDLQANEALGDEFQIQAAQIARDNVEQNRAIQDAAAKDAERLDRETDEMYDDTTAASHGAGSEDYAEAQALQERRLDEGRLSDQELLARLGVSGSDALSELAQAELMQTKNNAVQIRTSANDQITSKREEAASRWGAPKQEILGSLTQGAMDNELKNREFGLGVYQMKMGAAKTVRDAQQSWLQQQQGFTNDLTLAGAKAQGQSGMTTPEQVKAMSTGSGVKVMLPSGQPYELPIWWNSPEMANQLGVPEDMRAQVAALVSSEEIMQQLGH